MLCVVGLGSGARSLIMAAYGADWLDQVGPLAVETGEYFQV